MSGLLPWAGAAAAVLAAQMGVLAALGLGANLTNAAVLGVLGLPGFGLLLAAPWLLR